MPLAETVLLLMALLATGVFAAGLFRNLPIPYTVLLVLIGMGLDALADHWPVLEALHRFRLTPELVLFIFLPALIFESGFSLNARQLIKDIGPVLTMAVPALLFSTAAIGLFLWLLLPLSLGNALLFGALISATDPVAVISLFKELGTPLRLTVLVEGESLLNDATAIVVFTILLGLALHGGFTLADAGHAVGEFFRVFIGGAAVGALFGLGIAWLMTRLKISISGVLILSLVLAYAAFIVAEHSLHVSGVMAVAAAAVTLGVFGAPRLPHQAGEVLHETWEFLAYASNTLLFLLVGLSVHPLELARRLDVILLAVVIVLAVRAATVYSMVPVATRLFRLPRVTMGERHIMWWGGLKGGLAIAIALSIPEDLPGRQLLLDLTVGVVLFSLLVNAPTIRPLIRWLGIDRLTDDERAELRQGITHAQHRVDTLLERFMRRGLLSRASHHQVRESASHALQDALPEVSEESSLRSHRLNALRAELQELEELYSAGVIRQYTFLDLRGELQRKRDHVVAGLRGDENDDSVQPNFFLRLEDALLKRMREHDWAAPLMAHYQNLRLSQHLVRDIARTLMTEAALDYIRGEEEMEKVHREELLDHYRECMAGFRTRITDVRNNFPDFFRRFEQRLSTQASLIAAIRQLEKDHRSGSIGAKAFTVLEQRLRHALQAIPPISAPLAELEVRDLIGLVPLFAGLPPEALEGLSRHTRSMNFIAGDTIIGQGERGDALYIVVRGRVSVTQHDADGKLHVLAEFNAGDFFGEMALLEDQVRTANVTALHPCTLLRLTRRDVFAIAEKHPEVAARLEAARKAHAQEKENRDVPG